MTGPGPGAAAQPSERALALPVPGGVLHGTLLLPAAPAHVTAILFVAGSGPVDRDGNLPGLRNDGLRRLAERLARAGIASLRADKRGVGAGRAAGADEAALRPATYVEDALAWLGALRTEPRVARVALLGHSEGALLATLAAQRAGALAGLVLLAGAGEPAGRVILRQLAGAGLDGATLAQARRILERIGSGQDVPDVPPALAPLFRPPVQPYLRAWLAFDPAQELARVPGGVPVTVIAGTHDLQVTPEDARRLAAARPGAGLVLLEGMNHVLREAPAERAANLATYGEPGLDLAPGLAAAVAASVAR